MISDDTAEEFSQYMKKYRSFYCQLANVVKKNIKTSAPVILDIGAGPGLLSKEIMEIIPDATMINADPSMKMLQLSREDAIQKNTFSVQCISEKIPLQKNSVDVVVSRFSLPYWEHPESSFADLYRILRPNGRMILEVLDGDFPRWRLFLIRLQMMVKLATKDVVRYHIDAFTTAYTRSQVNQMLTDAHFDVIEYIEKKNDWKFIVIAEKKET